MQQKQKQQPGRDYEGLVKNRQKRKRWQQIVSTLVCIVVFCTTYALILPAITISGEATCGMVEHTHSADCYELIEHPALNCVRAHTHEKGCYNAQGELACGISDQLIHIHNEYCLDEDGALLCQLEEYTGHLHSSFCYTVQLSEDGTETQTATLTCGKEGLLIHSHTSACFGEGGKILCGLEETLVHVHSASCLSVTYTLGDLTCQLQEHVHTEECYEEFPEDLRSALLLMSTDDSDQIATDNPSIYEINNVKINYSAPSAEYDPVTGLYNVELEMEWYLNASQLEAYSAFHIELPDGLIIPDDLLDTWMSFTDNQNGMVAFDARFEKIDGKYYIHVEYREEYIAYAKEANKNVGDLDDPDFIQFKGQIDASNVNDKGEISLTWKDGTTTAIKPEDITYPPDETRQYDIHTQKTVSYNSATGELNYTVKVSSNKGTPSPINISDVLTANGVTLKELSGVTVVDQNGTAVSATSTNDLGTGALNITVNEALQAGEYYLITYTYKIDPIAEGSVYYPNNKVTATAQDNTTKENVTSSANASVKVDKEMVNKTGSYDPETKLITWTIVVNPDGDDIAGYVLTDDMMKLAQSLSVKGSNVSGTVDETAGYTVDYETGTVTFTAAAGGTNKNTYTITYTTYHDQTTVNTPVNNTVVLKDNNGEEIKTNTGTAGVTVPGKGNISKDGTLNPSTGIIDWSVFVDVPDGGIGAGTQITDKLGPSWGIDKNHWMTQKQIYDLAEALKTMFPNVDYTLEFSTDAWNWTEYSKALQDTGTSAYYAWRLTFNEAVTDAEDFTIDYSTTADLSSVTSEATYQNTAQMGYYSAWDSVTYKPTATKLDRYYRSKESSVTVTDGVIGWFIKIAPQTDKTSISLTDTLPAGLTLMKVGVGTDGNTAVSTAVAATASGTVKDWNQVKAEYTVSGNTVSATITSQTDGANLPNSDIYFYVECLIQDLPGPGETQKYVFKNEATVDGYPVDQTQKVTVNIPERVIKTDSNGNESDTQFHYNADNRTLGWYVKIFFDQEVTDTITITDTLPDGLTLTKVGLASNTTSARYDNYYYSSIPSGSTGGAVASTGASYTLSGNTLTVTTDQDYEEGSYLYLYVEGTFEELTNDTQEYLYKDFLNKVSVKVGTTDIGSDQQKQTVVVPPPAEEPKVDKLAIWNDKINQLNYQVLINPEGKDLSLSKDSIDVTDVLSYDYNIWWNTVDSALIPGSVKLYEVQKDTSGNILKDSNGNYLLGAEVKDGWSWTYSDNLTDVQNGGTMNKTISATVPDNTALILVYTYEISVRNGGGSGWINISNSVSVAGDTSYGDNTNTSGSWEASEVSGGATSASTYTIHKVLKGNYNIVLPGAEFTIYTYADNAPLMDGEGNIVTLVTDENGALRVNTSLGYFEEDVVYYIVETKAPPGYDLPAEPTKYYFYFKGESADGYYVPEGAVDLNNGYGIAYVENEPEAVHAISIDKIWLDSSGNTITPPAGSISFHLIQKDYKGNEEHFFHNTLKDGLQIYPHHSVIWTAPATGTVALTVDSDVEIHDLMSGELVTLTDNSFATTEGTTYQIMIQDDDVGSLTWIYSGDDVDSSGTLELQHQTWSTTIVVPEYDDQGNKYTYTAKEIDVEGYVSEVSVGDDGNITITNRQEESTSISVEKAWRVDSMEKKPVQVQLYQTVDTLYTEYIGYLGFINYDGSLVIGSDSPATFTTSVAGTGTYWIRWDLSKYGFIDSVGTQALYVDIVDPNFALNGYTVTNYKIEADGVSYELKEMPTIAQHGGGITRITFHNHWDSNDNYADYIDGLPISADGYLYIEFTLTAPDGSDGILPDLYEYVPSAISGGTEYGDPVTLDEEVGWTYTWNPLPVTGTDINGNLVQYSYYVQELGDDYDVRYTYDYAVRGETIVINNFPKSTADLTVNKQWVDASGNTVAPPIDGVTYKLEQEQLCTVLILSGDWGYDNNSTQYRYVPPGSTVTVTFIGHEIQFAGSYSNIEQTKLGTLGGMDISRITVQRTISDLDLPTSINCSHGGYNDSGTWLGYLDGTYTLDDGTEVTLGIVSIEVTPPENYTPTFVSLGEFTLNEANNWTFVHEEIKPATYRLVETTTGYTTTYYVDGVETAVESDYWLYIKVESDEEKTVVVQNQTTATSLTVNKAWRDNGENSNVSRIAVTLHQVDADGNDVAFATGYLQKDGAGNWTLTFDGLPISDASGRAYKYYVVESALNGYYTTYSANGGKATTTASAAYLTQTDGSGDSLGTITITNRAVTSIGVKKQWADGVAQTAVKIQLWRIASTQGFNLYQLPLDANGNVDISALDAVADLQRTVYICCPEGCSKHDDHTQSKSKTFKNLDLYEFNDDGTVKTYYTYFILEDATGYIKTYTADTFMTGGSYEITNDVYTTSIGVDKQWSDGSTTPVDVTLFQQAVYYHVHTYENAVTAPTCSAQGYTTHTCTTCGFSYKAEFTEKVDHKYGDWSVTTAATCGKTGVETRYCIYCHVPETREIPATGSHNYVHTSTSGSIATYTCSVCGATKTEDVSSCAHTYGDWTVTKQATCTESGEQTRTCTKCGATETETIAASGHSYGDWYTVTAATCVAKGEQRRDCNNCDAYETQEIAIDPNAHSFTNYVSNGDATCTTDGTKTATCANGCGASDTQTDTGSMKDHTYVDGVCSVCGAKETNNNEVIFFSGSHVVSPSNILQLDFPEGFVFSTGGTFSVECKPTSSETDSAAIYIKLRWSQNQWEGTDILGWTYFSGTTTYSYSYEQLVDKLGDKVSKIISLEIGGDNNLTITKVTWTTAPAAQALSLNYESYAPMYLAGVSGVDTGKVLSVHTGVAYGTLQVIPGTTTTWSDLPRYILDSEGNIIGEYVYYVEEAGGPEYQAKYTYYDANGNIVTVPTSTGGGDILGITEGSVKILNTQQYHYELPSTGGQGTHLYTLGGIALLIGAAFVLMYNHKKGRKGAMIP